VRNHLMEAAATITVKGGGLADRLFVPEPFRADDKAAIELWEANQASHLIAIGRKPKDRHRTGIRLAMPYKILYDPVDD
jgi:hypothetical protein